MLETDKRPTVASPSFHFKTEQGSLRIARLYLQLQTGMLIQIFSFGLGVFGNRAGSVARSSFTSATAQNHKSESGRRTRVCVEAGGVLVWQGDDGPSHLLSTLSW